MHAVDEDPGTPLDQFEDVSHAPPATFVHEVVQV
jgi:hypothetical protein